MAMIQVWIGVKGGRHIVISYDNVGNMNIINIDNKYEKVRCQCS